MLVKTFVEIPVHVSVNIKNPEVYDAAARLAQLQGTTITAAVLNALRAELSREDVRRHASQEVQRMKEFAHRVAAMPVLDARTEEGILGYGPEGFLGGD